MENVVRPADNLRQQSQDPQGGSLDSTEGAGHGGHGEELEESGNPEGIATPTPLELSGIPRYSQWDL